MVFSRTPAARPRQPACATATVVAPRSHSRTGRQSAVRTAHSVFCVLVNTASAAGLLTQIDSGPYAVSKHAAVAFAEWLLINYADQGIGVSVLCPQGVNTAMAPKSLGDGQTDGIIEPEELARTVVEALREERFHVLPHPEVEEYVRRKGDNIDRWLLGMQRLRQRSIVD